MAQIMVMPNVAEFMIARWQATQNGLDDVPINPRNLANKEEFTHMIKTAMLSTSDRVLLLVHDEDLANQIDKLGVIGSDSIKVVGNGKPASGDWVSSQNLMRMTADDAANDVIQNGSLNKPSVQRILFTSGTTSLPKGCRQAPDDVKVMFELFESMPGDRGMMSSSIIGVVVPNNHAMSHYSTWWAHGKGGAVVFPGPTFNPTSFVETCHTERVTHTILVLTMVHAVSTVVAADGRKLESIHSLMLGGTMVTPPTLKLCKEIGADKVMNAFGMTEGVVIGSGALSELSDLVNRYDATVGKPLAGTYVKV